VSAAIPLRQAARALGLSVETVRRDVRRGCPTARLGGPGRNRGTLLDLNAYRRWRAAKRSTEAPEVSPDEWLLWVAAALRAFHREGYHVAVRLDHRDAAALLVCFFEFVCARHGSTLKDESIELLRALAKQ
jgi:hypothetical protein